MPEAQEKFQSGIAALLEAVMFESWLRFYFIKDVGKDGEEELKLELPEKSMTKIKELYPHLCPMAQKLDGKRIDFEASRSAVLGHIAEQIDGKQMAKGEAERILQSATFALKLRMFHTWEELHEEQLERGFMDFGAWRSLFAKWLETDGAKALGKKIMES